MRRPYALATALAIALAAAPAVADKDTPATATATDPRIQARMDHARAERNHGGGNALDRVLDRLLAGRRLDAVIHEVELAVRAGQRPVVVFDIDDTLVKWKKVDGVKTEDWTPMPGSATYLRALEKAGAQIIYLTARPESAALRQETIGILETIGVPLGAQHEVIMAPEGWEGTAAEGKKLAAPRVRAKGRPVAFFDNDLANVRLFRGQYPEAAVFRVAGHSANQDPEPHKGRDGVHIVRDYTASRRARPDTRMPRRAATAGARARLRALPRVRPLQKVASRLKMKIRPRAQR